MTQYVVTSRANAVTKTNAPYAVLKVASQEGAFSITVWDLAPQQQPQQGEVVSFISIRDQQGKRSCSASEIVMGPPLTPDHPLYALVPHPIERQVWDATIAGLLELCTDQALKDIIADFGAKLYPPYSEYPAATSVHHAFPGGLLNHTHQMLQMFLAIYPSLPADVKPERCILAILFHDYGKVYEYNRAGEPQEDKFLLGHIYIGAHKLHSELERRDVEPVEVKRIVHCILAHHGRLEYGSPVVPCTPEAEVVNHLDDISAKTDHMGAMANLEKSYILGTHVVK